MLLYALCALYSSLCVFAEPLIDSIYVFSTQMLRLSCTARKECSGGAVVNLMSVDAQKIQECFNWSHYTMTSPVEVGVAFAILWSKIGAASVVGIVFLVVVVPLNSTYIGHRIKVAQVCCVVHYQFQVD